MNRRCTILTMLAATQWLVAQSATAENANAEALMTEADDIASKARCGGAGCDGETFAVVVAKYEEAVKLDPSPVTALRYCKRFQNARGGAWKWKLAGPVRKAIARCDLAALHPDSDKETRERGAGAGTGLRSELDSVWTQEQRNERIAAAARALYGEGLAIAHDNGAGTVTFGWGTLDAKTIEEYTVEFYAPLARSALVGTGADFFLDAAREKEFRELGEKGVYGWVLAEPRAKLEICLQMVKRMTQKHVETEAFCRLQAAIEANAPILAFRGKAATVDATGKRGAAMDPTERIHLPDIDGAYPLILSVAGPGTIDDYRHLSLQRRIAHTITESRPTYKGALALIARGEKIAKEKKAALAKVEKKLKKKQGNVVFSDAPFEGWDLPRILGKGEAADCEKLHYKAYAPPDGEYEAEISVDGDACHTVWVYSPDDESARPDSLMRSSETGPMDTCPKKLLVPGEHEVSIAIFVVNAEKTGDYEITENLRIREGSQGVRGKMAGAWSVTCTTNE